MLSEEQWRPVAGFEGLYEVSDEGRVRSFPRPVRVRGNGIRVMGGKVLTPHPLNHGHQLVFLYPGHVARTVHALVAEAFLGPRPEGNVIRHLDGNPENNRLSNLCYGTQSDNLRDCYLSYDGRVGPGTLSRAQVLEIRSLLAEGLRQVDIARKFGVSKSAINHIKSGRTYGYLPNNI